MLLRTHERLGRDLSKQKDDDRARRLEALKANDFEAYQELLRQTKGPQTGDDRFKGIVLAAAAAPATAVRSTHKVWWQTGGCTTLWRDNIRCCNTAPTSICLSPAVLPQAPPNC